MWPFSGLFRCNSEPDYIEEIIEALIVLLEEVQDMSANLDALNAAVADVGAKVDELLARPPVVVSDGVDDALPAVTAALAAISAKISPPVVPAP